MYYLIKEFLEEATPEECLKHEHPYVAIVSGEEFSKRNDLFDMGIDMDIDYNGLNVTKIEVNFDSLTGCFSIPDRQNVFGKQHTFSFALDEKGIVFIDDDGTALGYIERIMQKKRWRKPSLERFIYDFIEGIVIDDLKLFEHYDKVLDDMEDAIVKGDAKSVMERLVDLRGEVLEIHNHYEQLLDLCQELCENENNFFKAENLRYFDMTFGRIERLNHLTESLRERVMQVRDLHQTQLDVRQNKISTVLTIVATVFMPLTLIVGWYGMNFKYMPELESPLAYPIVIGISLLIVIGSIIYFKKKKWL